MPDSARAQAARPAPPSALQPAAALPTLEALALPPANVPTNADVREFLSMTAMLLKRMDQTGQFQHSQPAPTQLDISA